LLLSIRTKALLAVLATSAACSRTGLAVGHPYDAGIVDLSLDAQGDADAGVDAVVEAGCETQVSASAVHTCAVACGEVWCWGLNDYGQLGDGTVHSRGTPRRVEGIRARHVATGRVGLNLFGASQSCAVLEDGHVACWGARESEDLDDPANFEIRRPELVAGVDRARSVAVGATETCALREDGHLWCWSNVVFGAPVPDPLDTPDGIVQVTASLGSICALDRAGSIRCRFGSSFASIELPGPAEFLDQSCSVVRGRVYCWGYDRNTLEVTLPRPIALPVPVKQASGDETCGRAVSPDGRVWAWGADAWCKLWPWSETSTRAPAIEIEDFRADSVSSQCAWSDGAQISCWGPSSDSSLGDGREPFSTVPVEVVGFGTQRRIDIGEVHACAYGDGSAACWGTSVVGEIGASTLGVHLIPQVVPLARITEVSTSWLRSCATTEIGDLWCWGRGQLSNRYSPTPIRVPLSGTATDVGLGADYTCVALADGSVDCWGWLRSGVESDPIVFPGERVLAPGTAARIVNGLGMVCGLNASGTLTCEGENTNGDLGIGGPTPMDATPLLIVRDVIEASVGDGWYDGAFNRRWRRSSCVVRSSGALECWGYNGFGQVGDGTYEHRAAPVRVELDAVRSVDVGRTHSCAIDATGRAWCWGDNRFGQLGDGTENPSPVPVRVLLDGIVTNISVGTNTSCARVASGSIYCWGSDAWSLLGRANPPPIIDRPQRVILAP